MRAFRALALVLPVLFVVLPLGRADAAPAPLARADTGESLLLVLDSSGSMKEPDRSGTSKIQAAKAALRSVVADLPADAHVGMRVYGATVFDKSEPGACRDSQLVVPVGPVDRGALRTQIDAYQPHGETPIAYALSQAASDLGPDGKRRILLVSDGEETCAADPCQVARQIHEAGIDLVVDVVGMSVPEQSRRQLECIADAGGGTYCETGTPVEVAACLGRTALRDARTFSVTGEPVEGGLQPGDAPDLGAGQFTDALGGDEEPTGLKYYRVPRFPGSRVHAAVTARTDDPEQSDGLDIALVDSAGGECASGSEVTLSEYQGNPVINAAAIFTPDEADASGCDAEPALWLEVRRGNEIQDRAPDTGELPIEIVVTIEPEVTNLPALPEQVVPEEIDERMPPPGPTRGNVVGGVSFSSAPELAPGTWSDSLQTGEMLFYRVSADWGQSVRFRVRLHADPGLAGEIDLTTVTMFVYAPDRTPISLTGSDLGHTGSYRGNQDVTVAASLPEIRYRNREHYSFDTSRVGPTSLAGTYYVAVHLRDEPGDERFQVRTDLSAEVSGAPSGVPEYAEDTVPSEGTSAAGPSGDGAASGAPTSPTDEAASDSAEAEPVSTEPDGEERWRPAVVVAAVGAALIALLAVGVLLVARRR
jgi:Ca-activated chloride channel family protein